VRHLWQTLHILDRLATLALHAAAVWIFYMLALAMVAYMNDMAAMQLDQTQSLHTLSTLHAPL
jgi:hypothetical protein